jgi:hypothetical protein
VQTKFSPGAFAFGGVVALLMALTTVGGRLLIEVDGTITAREETSGNRRAAIYTVSSTNGSITTFTSGATDASLPRNLPVGSHITKRKWELAYTLNGQQVSDFSIGFYGGVFVLAGCLLWFSTTLAVQQWHESRMTRRRV